MRHLCNHISFEAVSGRNIPKSGCCNLTGVDVAVLVNVMIEVVSCASRNEYITLDFQW